MNLAGADLTDANLNTANLTRANLTGANLRRADFTNAILFTRAFGVGVGVVYEDAAIFTDAVNCDEAISLPQWAKDQCAGSGGSGDDSYPIYLIGGGIFGTHTGRLEEIDPLILSSSVGDLNLDTIRGKMYWIGIGSGAERQYRREAIYRANLDGSNIEVIVDFWESNEANPPLPYDGGDLGDRAIMEGIAVDPINGKIYWTRSYYGYSHRLIEYLVSLGVQIPIVYRANLDGTGIEIVTISKASYPSAPMLRGDIQLDIASRKMYAINNSWLYSGSMDGDSMNIIRFYWNTDPSADIGPSAGFGSPGGPADLSTRVFALDRSASKIYFQSDTWKGILVSNLDGSGLEYILRGTDFSGIAIDSDKMYWADLGERKIKRANLDGSDIETLIDGVFRIVFADPPCSPCTSCATECSSGECCATVEVQGDRKQTQRVTVWPTSSGSTP